MEGEEEEKGYFSNKYFVTKVDAIAMIFAPADFPQPCFDLRSHTLLYFSRGGHHRVRQESLLVE
jgi:hypothetical protein